MITTERKRLIQDSLRLLAATHATAVAQIESTMAVLVQALELEVAEDSIQRRTICPHIDKATFTVAWKGRTCFLGNTLLFLLFERLVQTPNRYVTHTELLERVWQSERQTSTIRGVAKRLRDRLAKAGMTDLAEGLEGVAGHYGLIFV